MHMLHYIGNHLKFRLCKGGTKWGKERESLNYCVIVFFGVVVVVWRLKNKRKVKNKRNTPSACEVLIIPPLLRFPPPAAVEMKKTKKKQKKLLQKKKNKIFFVYTEPLAF